MHIAVSINSGQVGWKFSVKSKAGGIYWRNNATAVDFCSLRATRSSKYIVREQRNLIDGRGRLTIIIPLGYVKTLFWTCWLVPKKLVSDRAILGGS